jgi:hypothetical protein
MKCKCGGEFKVYELFQRSHRLYAYVCKCNNAFLAHHFDIGLGIYKMKDLKVKRSGDIIFLTGLSIEPRVFDFKIRDGEVVVVADETHALGELALRGYVYSPYSEKKLKTICRRLNCDPKEVAMKLAEKWKRAE